MGVKGSKVVSLPSPPTVVEFEAVPVPPVSGKEGLKDSSVPNRPAMRPLLQALLLAFTAISATPTLREGEVCFEADDKWYCSRREECLVSTATEGKTGQCVGKEVVCCPSEGRTSPPPNPGASQSELQLLSGWSGSWDKPPANKPWKVPAQPESHNNSWKVSTSQNFTSLGINSSREMIVNNANNISYSNDSSSIQPTSSRVPAVEPVIQLNAGSVITQNISLTVGNLTELVNFDAARDIAEKMCKDYAKYVFMESRVVTYPGAIPTKINFCASRTKPLIVGGEDAQPMEFPHMARIGYEVEKGIKWWCGGSLISARYILSAAHCSQVDDRLAKWANLGDLDISTNGDNASPVTVKIAEIFVHPGYKIHNSWYSDIALFKLAEDVPLGIHVRPACMSTRRKLKDSRALVSGWGHTKSLSPFATEVRGDDSGSNILQKAELNIIPSEQCNDTYNSLSQRDSSLRKNIKEGIRSDMICAGGVYGRTVCNGDSGGPLQVIRSDPYCMYDIVGVTSFGSGCKSDVPAVYTNVVEYLPWIIGIVQPTNISTNINV